jgi:hypothetical protein
VEQSVPDKPENTNKSTYNGFIKDGVEVVDVKAIEKQKPKVDKFGIPIQPGEHRNFDRI